MFIRLAYFYRYQYRYVTNFQSPSYRSIYYMGPTHCSSLCSPVKVDRDTRPPSTPMNSFLREITTRHQGLRRREARKYPKDNSVRTCFLVSLPLAWTEFVAVPPKDTGVGYASVRCTSAPAYNFTVDRDLGHGWTVLDRHLMHYDNRSGCSCVADKNNCVQHDDILFNTRYGVCVMQRIASRPLRYG